MSKNARPFPNAKTYLVSLWFPFKQPPQTVHVQSHTARHLVWTAPPPYIPCADMGTGSFVGIALKGQLKETLCSGSIWGNTLNLQEATLPDASGNKLSLKSSGGLISTLREPFCSLHATPLGTTKLARPYVDHSTQRPQAM